MWCCRRNSYYLMIPDCLKRNTRGLFVLYKCHLLPMPYRRYISSPSIRLAQPQWRRSWRCWRLQTSLTEWIRGAAASLCVTPNLVVRHEPCPFYLAQFPPNHTEKLVQDEGLLAST